jgi:hypothetical protein
MQRYLFSAYHFPVFFQTATFEIQRLKCNVTCFPDIIFRTFSNRKVWNATLLVFLVSFSRTFSKISRLSQKKTDNVWKYNVITYFLEMFTLSLQTLFNFIYNAAYRFHYTCNNDNSWTISFIWFLGYLVEIPQWERGRDRKHPWSTKQHSP